MIADYKHALARPHFDPPKDWPTNREIIERALRGHRLLSVAETADAIVDALAANHRLISPTIERTP